jgi:hypothetical protein
MGGRIRTMRVSLAKSDGGGRRRPLPGGGDRRRSVHCQPPGWFRPVRACASRHGSGGRPQLRGISKQGELLFADAGIHGV